MIAIALALGTWELLLQAWMSRLRMLGAAVGSAVGKSIIYCPWFGTWFKLDDTTWTLPLLHFEALDFFTSTVVFLEDRSNEAIPNCFGNNEENSDG